MNISIAWNFVYCIRIDFYYKFVFFLKMSNIMTMIFSILFYSNNFVLIPFMTTNKDFVLIRIDDYEYTVVFFWGLLTMSILFLLGLTTMMIMFLLGLTTMRIMFLLGLTTMMIMFLLRLTTMRIMFWIGLMTMTRRWAPCWPWVALSWNFSPTIFSPPPQPLPPVLVRFLMVVVYHAAATETCLFYRSS